MENSIPYKVLANSPDYQILPLLRVDTIYYQCRVPVHAGEHADGDKKIRHSHS
jgi:hypothetical protein